jgi:DNA-binding transcriptional regulator GbsR (MarR family)
VLFQSFVYTASMDRDKILIYADHMGRYQAQRHGLPPVVGRVVGYLSVCQPMEQSINEIADALLASRSAINNALTFLDTQKLIKRSRPAGSRADLISINSVSMEAGFDPTEYQELAALAREGLELLKDAPAERRESLEATASLGDFLAERLPKLYEEWDEYHKRSQQK